MSEPGRFGALESWVPCVRGDFGEAGWWHPSVLHCGLGVMGNSEGIIAARCPLHLG